MVLDFQLINLHLGVARAVRLRGNVLQGGEIKRNPEMEETATQSLPA